MIKNWLNRVAVSVLGFEFDEVQRASLGIAVRADIGFHLSQIMVFKRISDQAKDLHTQCSDRNKPSTRRLPDFETAVEKLRDQLEAAEAEFGLKEQITEARQRQLAGKPIIPLAPQASVQFIYVNSDEENQPPWRLTFQEWGERAYDFCMLISSGVRHMVITPEGTLPTPLANAMKTNEVLGRMLLHTALVGMHGGYTLALFPPTGIDKGKPLTDFLAGVNAGLDRTLIHDIAIPPAVAVQIKEDIVKYLLIFARLFENFDKATGEPAGPIPTEFPGVLFSDWIFLYQTAERSSAELSPEEFANLRRELAGFATGTMKRLFIVQKVRLAP